MLQARSSLNAKKQMAEWMCTSLDSGGGQVFKFLKGAQQPDTMISALFACAATDPGQVLKEELEWRSIWPCDDPAARAKTCRAIRSALSEARMVSDFGGGTSQIRSGSELAGGARSFKKTTSTGGDSWPLNGLARVQ